MEAINTSYIGITGITRLEELDWIKTILKRHPTLNRKIMLGFLMNESLATVFDIENTKTRYVSLPQLYALMIYIKEIGISNQVLGFVHLNAEPNSYHLAIHNILNYCEIDGIQLNIYNPRLEDLKSLIHRYPHLKWVYQIKPRIDLLDWAKRMSNSEKEVLAKVDYLLLDSSEGRGILCNPDKIKQQIFQLKEIGFQNKIVFAGGLSGNNLNIFQDLIKEYSFDAEGRLRDEEDKLDQQKVQNYLEMAIGLISEP